MPTSHHGLMVTSLSCHTTGPGSIPGRTSFKFPKFFLIIEDRLIEDRLSDTNSKSVWEYIKSYRLAQWNAYYQISPSCNALTLAFTGSKTAFFRAYLITILKALLTPMCAIWPAWSLIRFKISSDTIKLPKTLIFTHKIHHFPHLHFIERSDQHPHFIDYRWTMNLAWFLASGSKDMIMIIC